MNSLEVKVPNVGIEGDVEVIEICVSSGDIVSIDDALVVLESDKATVEVPCPFAGEVQEVSIGLGDKVTEGALILIMRPTDKESIEPSNEEITEPKPVSDQQPPIQSNHPTEHDVTVPDLGGSELVEVIEIVAEVGQALDQEDTLIVLESDKATMEIPTPIAGTVKSILVNIGEKISSGHAIATVLGSEVNNEVSVPPLASQEVVEVKKAVDIEEVEPLNSPAKNEVNSTNTVHAGPSVRKSARELDVDLTRIQASGPKGRILKQDLHLYIKEQVRVSQGLSRGNTAGSALPHVNMPDFASYGEIETVQMNKIQRLTAQNMVTSWLTVPHVTQFDEADITDLEQFRKQKKNEASEQGIKLTPMAFLLKASAYALKALPQFNVSLNMEERIIIQKKYIHIGIAVDTPNGLVVPVVKDVEKKSLFELAMESQSLAAKAKEKKLSPSDMQGGCFTISSLGAMSGTSFTPIVNTPEVAILGVSKAQHRPVYTNSGTFEPRLIMPLSLSYDHRAVNGADAARFTGLLAKILGDLRELLL